MFVFKYYTVYGVIINLPVHFYTPQMWAFRVTYENNIIMYRMKIDNGAKDTLHVTTDNINGFELYLTRKT